MISDQVYLKENQYKNPSNLDARITLHKLYATNSYGWHKWVFDQIGLRPGMHVLEVGSGTGMLWAENINRLPVDIKIVAGDLSAGMVNQTAKTFADLNSVSCLVLDAQLIPLESEIFDVVIANHMLYHVPKIETAIRELRRVMKKNSLFCAATNGISHMHELFALIVEFFPDFISNTQLDRFSLESASEILQLMFRNVELRCYVDNLQVTDAAPAIAYLNSLFGLENTVVPNVQENLKNLIDNKIRSAGSFTITKSQGIFLARK